MAFIIQDFVTRQYIKDSIFKNQLPLSKEKTNAKEFSRKGNAENLIKSMHEKFNNPFFLHNMENNESFLIIK